MELCSLQHVTPQSRMTNTRTRHWNSSGIGWQKRLRRYAHLTKPKKNKGTWNITIPDVFLLSYLLLSTGWLESYSLLASPEHKNMKLSPVSPQESSVTSTFITRLPAKARHQRLSSKQSRDHTLGLATGWNTNHFSLQILSQNPASILVFQLKNHFHISLPCISKIC